MCMMMVVGVGGRFDVYAMPMAAAKLPISHHHQFNEEEDEDCHQDDSFYPRILGYQSPEAWVPQSIICWREQLNDVSPCLIGL